MRYIAGAVASLTAGLLLSVTAQAQECRPVAVFPTIEKGVLTVAANNNPGKFTGSPGDAELGGISGKSLTLFARENCLKINLKLLSGPAAVQTMSQGNADIAGGDWSKSTTRSGMMQESTTLWYEPTAIASKAGFDTIESLMGKVVAANSASNYFAEMQRVFGTERARGYSENPATVRDLVAGRVDAVIDSYANLVFGARAFDTSQTVKTMPAKPDEKYPGLTFLIQNNWYHKKDNPQLTVAINAFVNRIRGDGTMAKILTEAGFDADKALTGKW